jgi:hypothetical protein
MSIRLIMEDATAVWWQKSPDAIFAAKTWSISLLRARNPASSRASVAA